MNETIIVLEFPLVKVWFKLIWSSENDLEIGDTVPLTPIVNTHCLSSEFCCIVATEGSHCVMIVDQELLRETRRGIMCHTRKKQ